MDKIERAREHLAEICKDPYKFKMSIPPQPDDSDIIFSEAFDQVEFYKYRRRLEIDPAVKKEAIRLLKETDLSTRAIAKALDNKISFSTVNRIARQLIWENNWVKFRPEWGRDE